MARTSSAERAALTSQVLIHLSSRIAHDLNNHLATILGKAEIAMMVEDPARWRRSLEDAHAAGQKARVLVADYQRIQGWMREQEREPVPYGDVLAIVARLSERRLGRLGVVLEPGYATPRRCERACELALTLWELALALGEALEGEGERTWTLSAGEAGGGISVDLSHPGARWPGRGDDADDGDEADDATARLHGLAAAAGATLSFLGESTRLTFS
jgi:signal transduction histidine kinase